MVPVVKGGQGRTPREIRESAQALGWFVAAFVVLVVALILGGLK